MALNSIELENFRIEIKKASEELKLNELLFQTEWVFDLPTQSLKIGEVMLHDNYNISIGWDGYGIEDLDILEQQGFLKKIFETEKDPITLEQTIKYLII
ncbi:hypothetical protein ACFQO9_19815 [Chryseobacterium zhengzhouense]|uniref:DUF2442 domain-containing protein n=1 Tax=Chryseobacterium zhengzhouense TaxID=1636086 RepID=A0ABW2M5E8_9FLAO